MEPAHPALFWRVSDRLENGCKLATLGRVHSSEFRLGLNFERGGNQRKQLPICRLGFFLSFSLGRGWGAEREVGQ